MHKIYTEIFLYFVIGCNFVSLLREIEVLL